MNLVGNRQRRVSIHVNFDGSVEVDAPVSMSSQDVKRAIGKRARWLCRQVDEALLRYDGLTPRKYVSGETHFYLGRRYLLKRLPEDNGTSGVKLKDGQLQIRCDNATAVTVKALLDEWYKKQAARVFSRRMNALLEITPWVKDCPPIRIRHMRKRWGSCSTHGPITLNPILVKAPTLCIDGVLIHELCHLKIGNHSPAFYRLLLRTLPDWKLRKLRLDGMVERLMQD
ncbi:M48 family metallopeptidase [Granulosicoccus sp.]|nr:M48 family metallopeptidase [Granulosicoccus sp.]